MPCFRSLVRAVPAAVLFASALVSAAGCSADKEPPRGQLILAFQTDMNIPKDIRTIRVIVSARGEVRHNVAYFLRPGEVDGVQLPATFAIVAGKDPSLPVNIKVVGSGPGVGADGKSRVLREVTTTVPSDRFALLHMPIQWLCWDNVVESEIDGITQYSDSCGEGKTCIKGSCEDSAIDSSTLPTFDNALVFGGAPSPSSSLAQCIDVLGCFAQGQQVAVDTSDCSVALPGGSAEGANLGLVLAPGDQGICSSTGCVVVLDKDELLGWTQSAGRALLPKAVCDKLGSSVTGVALTTACTTKTTAIPTCGAWSLINGTFSEDAGVPAALDGGAEGGLDASTDGSVGDGGVDAGPDFCVGKPDGGNCSTPGSLTVCQGSVTQATLTCPFGCVTASPSYCAGDPNPPSALQFGSPCWEDAECSGLTCLTAGGLSNGTGPDWGVCTTPCSAWTDTCSQLQTGAVCQTFPSGEAFCMQGCSVAATGVKCSNRPDLACAPSVDVGKGVAADACVPVCAVPNCTIPEPPGQDAGPEPNPTPGTCSLVTGLCGPFVAGAAAKVGANCAVTPCTDAVCLTFTTGSGTTQTCSGACSLGGFCAAESSASVQTAGCLWPEDAANIVEGNAGRCMQLCSCSDPCSNPDFDCVEFPSWLNAGQAQVFGAYGGTGYCAGAVDATGAATTLLGC